MTTTKTTQQHHERNLYQRIHAARKNFQPIVKSKTNPAFKGAKFADLDAVVSAVEDALYNEGVLIQGQAQPFTADSWNVGVKLVNIDNPSDFIAEWVPCKEFSPQKQGAAITYSRRYLLGLILNLLTEDDDDGNIASGVSAPTTTVSSQPTPNGDW